MKQKIKEKLFTLSDKKFHDFHSALCPGTNNIIGIRVPVLRDYAKEIYKEKDWKKTIKEIDNEYYEEIMLQGMLIGQSKDDINIIIRYVEDYVPKIDNWAICDTFCAGLKITKKYKKEMWKVVKKYLKSKNEFEIRFAVVMILNYYIGDEYLQEIYKMLGNIKNEDYYVKMAVAWAISVCLIKYYDETIAYLKNANINDWTYNKAIQKAIESYRISDERKEELRKIKRIKNV